ncbi:hypothetical protein ABW21_db0209862 [Orbilia brochopaga]|nr:hypothetical protein ABW21_db0209862 [Drechslerella brochopaga]
MQRIANSNFHPATVPHDHDHDHKNDHENDHKGILTEFPFPKPPCPTTTPTPTPTPAPGPKKCGGLAGFQCDKGEICIDDPKSPCGIAVDCLGICVVEEFCGGFAGFPCSKPGDVCIDDPRDDCSPKTGGADCGGLCIPKGWAKY